MPFGKRGMEMRRAQDGRAGANGRLKNDKLLRTNLMVSIILMVGFILTAVFSYHANYRDSLERIEQVSSLSTEGIYYQLSSMFTRPVNVSLTMSHDRLLVQHLALEKEHMEDEAYERLTRDYLEGYRKKYGFDSVFLVSSATERYYNFNGVDRVLTEGNPENTWYYDLMDSDMEYSLNVDNDEVEGAENEITVFVNCKVVDDGGAVVGVVGVGIRINYLKEMLGKYERRFHVQASLVGQDGLIEVSTNHTGYEKIDWFGLNGQEGIRQEVLGWGDDASNLELWSPSGISGNDKSYIAVRYIPELSWHLVVKQDTGRLIQSIKVQMYQTVFLIVGVILTVLVVITSVIRNFNKQITELMEERQAMFKKATEQLYDNIYELNITKNCYVGERTKAYFEDLGARGLPYDKVLRVIAEKQIKEEFREGYVSTFLPDNVLREYELGNDHLRYDFMMAQEGGGYFWMRIDAYIFYSSEDDSIHMFTYRKNIDEEKHKEMRAELDEMTGLYSKKATERAICKAMEEGPKDGYAFFIFDIDDFKQANDMYGHAFGDFCIREFAAIIRSHFRDGDILGRIGGDEFAAFIPIQNEGQAMAKARELSEALDKVCQSRSGEWKMTASIGVAIAPRAGHDFESLYEHADQALYQTKQSGKRGYTFYEEDCGTEV